MKKLLLALATLIALFGIVTYEKWLVAPPIVQAQIHVFCAQDIVCAVTAAWTFKTFEQEQNVDSTLQRGGADIGAEINLAYAALPYVSGATGKINVYLPPTDVCYLFSTPILLNTNLKPVVVDFHGACLTYTAATGTAITLDVGTGLTTVSASLQNFHLQTSVSTTSTGVVIGVPAGNGCQQCTMVFGEIDNFATGYSNGTPNVTLWNPKIGNNNTASSVCINIAAKSDDFRVYGGSIYQCNTLFNFATSPAGPATFFGTNFIEAKGGAAGTNIYVNQTVDERITFERCHFSALTIAPVFLNQTAGRAFFTDALFEDDIASGSVTSFMTSTGATAYVNISGGDVSTLGQTATEFVLFSTGASGVFYGVSNKNPAQIPLLWNTTYTGGNVGEFSTNGGGTRTVATGLVDNINSSQTYKLQGGGNNLWQINGGGGAYLAESGAIGGAGGFTALWADSTQHLLKLNNNNTGAQVVAASPNAFISPTAPTIAGAGCGGSAASIVVSNGTVAFKINVGTAPTTACTITMPAATTGWNCFATDITTNSTTQLLVKQTGAESTTSVTLTNFSDVAAASNFTANDILKVSCHAD